MPCGAQAEVTEVRKDLARARVSGRWLSHMFLYLYLSIYPSIHLSIYVEGCSPRPRPRPRQVRPLISWSLWAHALDSCFATMLWYRAKVSFFGFITPASSRGPSLPAVSAVLAVPPPRWGQRGYQAFPRPQLSKAASRRNAGQPVVRITIV